MAQSRPDAIAQLYDAQGNNVGMVDLQSVEDGVQLQTRIKGFDIAASGGQRGEHGFHIHEAGDCSASDFTSAGGHFNPTRTAHGLLDPGGPHAGDLPNLWIEADGSADYSLTTNLVSLKPSERYLFDSDGSAFIIHAGPDDYITDPSGDSGSRLACGVIEPVR
jgi:Cu-Zn family superoxide dismutase